MNNKRSTKDIQLLFIAFVIWLFVLTMFSITLSSCDSTPLTFSNERVWNYNYAIVRLPNDELIEGIIQSWREFSDTDKIQVKINDEVYLVHSTNAILIYKNMGEEEWNLNQ